MYETQGERGRTENLQIMHFKGIKAAITGNDYGTCDQRGIG